MYMSKLLTIFDFFKLLFFKSSIVGIILLIFCRISKNFKTKKICKIFVWRFQNLLLYNWNNLNIRSDEHQILVSFGIESMRMLIIRELLGKPKVRENRMRTRMSIQSQQWSVSSNNPVERRRDWFNRWCCRRNVEQRASVLSILDAEDILSVREYIIVIVMRRQLLLHSLNALQLSTNTSTIHLSSANTLLSFSLDIYKASMTLLKDYCISLQRLLGFPSNVAVYICTIIKICIWCVCIYLVKGNTWWWWSYVPCSMYHILVRWISKDVHIYRISFVYVYM